MDPLGSAGVGSATPQGPPTPDAPKRKGAAFIWSGSLVLAAGIVAGVVMIAMGFGNLADFVSKLKSVPVPGRQSIHFEPGDYSIYSSGYSSTYSGPAVSDVKVTITSPSGEAVPTRAAGTSTNRSVTSGSSSYTSMKEFTIATAGTYEVVTARTTSSSSRRGTTTVSTVSIGPSSASALGSSFGLMGGGVGAGALGFVVGLALLIVGLVRRASSKPRPVFVPRGVYGMPPGGWAGMGPPGPYWSGAPTYGGPSPVAPGPPHQGPPGSYSDAGGSGPAPVPPAEGWGPPPG